MGSASEHVHRWPALPLMRMRNETSLTDSQFPILVIDSKHAFEVSGSNKGRGAAKVWFEHGDGTRASRKFSREDFLSIADTSAPLRNTWPPEDYACGFGRDVADGAAGRPRAGRPELRRAARTLPITAPSREWSIYLVSAESSAKLREYRAR